MSVHAYLITGLTGLWRSAAGSAAVSAAYVFLAVFAWLSGHPVLRPAGLVLAALLAFLGWLASARRYHLIADTPTARIASAAQGYVELVGRCDMPPGAPALGYRSGPPSVWYRFVVTRERGDVSEIVDQGESDDTFMLRDDSGECVVDPQGAEVSTAHQRQWRENGYDIRVSYLVPGETVYVLGRFRTESAAGAALDKRADLSAKLALWKSDRGRLLERFDRNRDGDISLAEWEVARAEAEKEIDAEHHEWRARPDIHVIGASDDDRPFLIANSDPRTLARRFRIWSWFHLISFLVASVTLLVLAGRGLLTPA